MADVFPVDFASDVGRVRKYIPDLRQYEDEYIFTDPEIQSFIDDQTQDGFLDTTFPAILRAAAWAINAIANDETLIMKKLLTEDLATDGPAEATALLKSAQELLKRADNLDDAAGEDELFLGVDYAPAPPRYGTNFPYPSYWRY